MKRIPLHLYLLLLFPIVSMARQQPPEKGLLWRITGNGLTSPSWLYGTIHLTDKRVFNFGDSLYAALEKSDGYAMELHPDSIMNKEFEEDESGALLKDSVAPKVFAKLRNKLKETYHKAPELVTVKEFKQHYRVWINRAEAGGMHTIMDAWFYNAARMQGKWVGGIEDVADQAGLEEEEPLSFYVDDFLNDHRVVAKAIEGMIDIYENEDLLGIVGYAKKQDPIMVRRNRKMARRMDSLAHLRSVFFAVGAGHLPGDSGVVMLLRKRGFTVEPVVSSKRVHAEAWHFAVKEIPWVTVQSNVGLYTVELPGEPQDTKVNVGNLDMKAYMDLGTNLFYLVMSGGKSVGIEDSIMAQAIRRMNTQATIASNKSITYDSVHGKEIIAHAKDGHYRMRMFFTPETMFLVMVSSPIDSAIHSTDAERFFHSFVMNKNAAPAQLAWERFAYPAHGFSIRFPGKPSFKTEKTDVSTTTTHYTAIDVANDIYFQVLVQDMNKGYYLTSDTATFRNYRDIISGNKQFHLNSYRLDMTGKLPTSWLDFSAINAGQTYFNRALNIHRGNRIYYVLVTASDSAKNAALINEYFSSFSLVPFEETTWKQHSAPDSSFSVWSPQPVERYVSGKDEDEAEETDQLFQLYDPSAPCTFFVRKSAFPKYYWADNDTSLLRKAADLRVGSTDTLLSYTLVSNGNYKGCEMVIGMMDNHNVKKLRMLLVGDTLLQLYGIGDPAMMELPRYHRLYTDFSINHQSTSTLFNNKAVALLTALQTGDSLDFAEAKDALDKVTFGRENLPLLHKAMLQWYRDTSSYEQVNNSLFNKVAYYSDPSTIDTIKAIWNTLPKEKEAMRYRLLWVIASQKTPAAFATAKELLLQHPPQKGEAYTFFEILRDSLELTKSVYNDLLPLFKDSVAAWQMVSLTESMLDSNLVTTEELVPWRPYLYKLSERALRNLKSPKHPWYNYHELINVLVLLKDPTANQWARKFLLQSNVYLKRTAALALLRNGLPVEASEWLKLGADKEMRATVYDDLVELKKTSLFPKQYYTEQAFAESQLYNIATDENSVRKWTSLGERIVTWKGQRRKFYLYRVDVSTEDGPAIHLGIAGPFGLKPGKPNAATEATGIYWEEDYNAAKIDTHLKAYLKQLEEYNEED